MRLAGFPVGQTQEGVVALAAGEDVSPHHLQPAFVVFRQRQPTALAGARGEPVFGQEIAAAVQRMAGVQRRALVRAALLFRSEAITTVEPDQRQPAVAAQVHAREAVAGDAAVLVHGDRRGEIAAVVGAGEAHIAGETLLEAP